MDYNSMEAQDDGSFGHVSQTQVDAADSEIFGTQMISCCMCGLPIPANPTATCNDCLRSRVDATEGIERNLVMPYCKHCDRYQRPPWLACAWESRELLALCLKRIRGLSGSRRDVRLVDASFLYTEPHSRRIKVKLTIQKEVAAATIVEQDCVVEFVIQPTQCDDCKRAFTPHTWSAVVQVRQRVQHKRSLLYLEQVILRQNAHEKVLQIIEVNDGLDFQFASKAAAQRFAEFVSSRLPTRVKSSKQLVSHDPKSNTAFNKHTFSVEVCPVCKDDLVFLPPNIASNIYGGISPFLLCTRVTSGMQLIDPFTLRGVDVACDKFWKHPFQPILGRRHLTSFIILNIENVDLKTVSTAASANRFVNPQSKGEMIDDDNASEGGRHWRTTTRNHNLVDVEIARQSDFGMNDNLFTVRSHLGRSLRVGDVCLGYDISTLNLCGSDEDLKSKIQYDVVLVKKVRKAGAKRPWLLQRLPMEKGTGGVVKTNKAELEEFKQDLEDDPVMRRDINLWKDPKYEPSAEIITEVEGEDLCELLQGLTLEDTTTNLYE